MTRCRSLAIAAVLAAMSLAPAFVTPARAQTVLNQTTLSAAVTATVQVIPLTSVSNITAAAQPTSVGDYLFVDREAMLVNALDTTAKTATVRRGVAGTAAMAHAINAPVWTGTPSRFYYNQVVGSCTATSEAFLPHIVLPSANSQLGGDIYDCIGSVWTRLRDDGGQPAAAGLVDSTSNASGTVQSTEYVLNTVTIPATDFSIARGVRCTAVGIAASNANAKTYKLYFGSTVVVTQTSVTSNAKDYIADMIVFRTGASTQRAYGSIIDGTSPSVLAEGSSTSMTEAEGSAIVVKFASINTAAAAASATGNGLYCHWLP